MPDNPKFEKCPVCGGFWFEGECYKCGAYLDGDTVKVRKDETPAPQPAAPAKPAEKDEHERNPKEPGWDQP